MRNKINDRFVSYFFKTIALFCFFYVAAFFYKEAYAEDGDDTLYFFIDLEKMGPASREKWVEENKDYKEEVREDVMDAIDPCALDPTIPMETEKFYQEALSDPMENPWLFMSDGVTGLSPAGAYAMSRATISAVDWGMELACKIKSIYRALNMSRIMLDSSTQMATDIPSFIMFGTDVGGISKCGLSNFVASGEEAGFDNFKSCNALSIMDDRKKVIEYYGGSIRCGSDESCNELYFNHIQRTFPPEVCDFNDTAIGGKGVGSVIGLTRLALDVAVGEPIPVNLAYQFKTTMNKIPVINRTALAESDTTSYGAIGLPIALGVWELTRNIALAMMSVIMIVIGIMIIMRKRISAQAVVTAQQAIPRVFISLFLIAFSYTIGATLASMAYGGIFIVLKVIFAPLVERISATGSLIDFNSIIMIIAAIILAVGPGGIIGTLGGLLMGVLLVVAILLAIFKVIIINLKMLLAIMLAPVQFALAAVPGNERLYGDWFKGMIAKALSIPGMFFMIFLGGYILTYPFLESETFEMVCTGGSGADPTVAALTAARGGAMRLVNIFLLPLFAIMSLFIALQVPKRLEKQIVGPK